MKDGPSIITRNSKGSGFPRTSQAYSPKWCFFVFYWSTRGAVRLEALKPGQTLTVDLCCEQLDRVKLTSRAWDVDTKGRGFVPGIES
uniref:Uncharacterized protein n=1 Tax=Glossina palpalis gambiensis TaxID=67801 RepID=A0A1B0C552_9MUSC